MNAQDSLRILPEIVLTITGVLMMLMDASLPRGLRAAAAGMGWRDRHHDRSLGQRVAA